MNHRPCRRGLLAAALALCAAPFAPAQAADWPDHTITLIAPFTPGGTTDIVARAIAMQLQQQLGQTVVVENKPGAGGTVGAALAARAKPDGYTLLQGNAGHTAARALYKDLSYDFDQGMTHISTVLTVPNVLLVAKNSPINSVRELLEYGKANAAAFNYGSAGMGTPQHLSAELLLRETGLKAQHIPFKGAAPMMTDLIAGRVHFAIDTAGSAISQIKGGGVKPLAVTSLKRVAALPDVPTLDESGVKGYDMTTWYSLQGPKGIPPAIVDRIWKAVQAGMKDPAMIRLLESTSAEPGGMEPAKLAKLVHEETLRMNELTKDMKQ
jgi:tripartite-type tricarboxylate transporter receptor subunit TctC